MADHDGLRAQKKQATREALRDAALRLALDGGLDEVRVDDIARTAGVSPRTYNNYFSSREQAIVSAVTTERATRIADAVIDAPDGAALADAVIGAVVAEYTRPRDATRDVVLLLTTSEALRDAYLEAADEVREPLATAVQERHPEVPDATADVLAASVAAAIRAGLRAWVRPRGDSTRGLVVPSGALPDLLRDALEVLRPSLDAAEHHDG